MEATQMIENAKKPDVPLAAEDTGHEMKGPPPGTVLRTLNYKDRRMILLACATRAAQEKKGDYKMMARLEKVKKMLVMEDVDDYFETIEDAVNEKVRAWTKEVNLFSTYEAWKSGGITEKKFRETFPEADISTPPEKPPFKMPRLSDDEKRGKSCSFHVPTKIDLFIEESLKEMHWGTGDSKFVLELAEKYQLPIED